MPELPDVEIFRRYMAATSLHQTISDVDARSRKVLEGVSPGRLRSGLRGRQFEALERHGKYLLARLDKDGWLALHFGMTGRLQYFKDASQDIQYVRLIISFDNGYRLGYESRRQLGKVRLLADADCFIRERRLGPDALSLGWQSFQKTLGRARGSIKSALMNQRLIAGLGNVYTDEILFQARIHPATQVRRLDDDGLKRTYRAMRRVLEKTIDCQADAGRFPRSYLIRHRSPDDQCPRCRTALRQAKLAGRTAYYCPRCQAEV